MRTAPAVTVEVQPDPIWRLGLAALVLVVAFALPGWVGAHLIIDPAPDTWAWSVSIGLTLASLWACHVAWRLRRAPCEALNWNGQVWQTLDARRQATPVTLSVAVDTGGWMLLQLRRPVPSGARRDGLAAWRELPQVAALQGSTWIVLSERRQPWHWHALRCAVHGPHVSDDRAPPLGARP